MNPAAVQSHREARIRRRILRAFAFNMRENLPFKMLSVLLATVLYFYVQSERNPAISRTFNVQITYENQPPELAVETEQQRITVTVTGPRSLVERIKEDDLRAVADLRGLRASEPITTVVRLRYTLQGESPNPLLILDPPGPPLKVTMYPPKTRNLPVVAEYPQEPAAGQMYGRAEIYPRTLTFSGRADRVNRVARLVVNAMPSQPGGRIDGDFPVVALDMQGNPVEDLKLSQDTVHVTVPLLPKPPQKIVLVSPEIVDLPLPPYKVVSITVIPHQVKLIGRHERLQQIATITTQEISIRDFTAPEELTVPLDLPADVMVRDIQDRPVTQARLRINVQRVGTPPAPPATAPAPAPSKTGSGTEDARDSRPPAGTP
ncbi:MAG: CdaR family protein [Chloroherpetonaceae bacterium]|nr:CdaR family protein [Chthonomonadaceae bacterium]MDW8207150.1 CdaR family protein [Chloroherpetonaceae bacterium]